MQLSLPHLNIFSMERADSKRSPRAIWNEIHHKQSHTYLHDKEKAIRSILSDLKIEENNNITNKERE